MRLPEISIIFPNWNGEQDTLAYLQSIRKSFYPQKEIEIIMVDNHSRDNSVKKVRAQFPEVKIIELDQNYGPAYARNRGIRQARGELIFCSDNDQILAANTLQIMATWFVTPISVVGNAYMRSLQRIVGIVGAKVLTKTELPQIVSCGYKFNRWLGIEAGLKNCDQIKECDWVAGCSMMFRKSLVNEIQSAEKPSFKDNPKSSALSVFDERFFFYAEDADFCLRAKKAGYRVISLPSAVVYHGKTDQTQPPTLLTDERYLDYYKAKFRLIRKHCNLLQQIISLGLHLTVFCWVRYITGRKENLPLKLKALAVKP